LPVACDEVRRSFNLLPWRLIARISRVEGEQYT
jgi:hypothetical protein